MAVTTSIGAKMELWTDLMGAHIYSLFMHLTGGPPEAPTNLVTSDATHQSFRATWTPPEDLPERYRVEYTSPTGQIRQVPSIIHLLRWNVDLWTFKVLSVSCHHLTLPSVSGLCGWNREHCCSPGPQPPHTVRGRGLFSCGWREQRASSRSWDNT